MRNMFDERQFDISSCSPLAGEILDLMSAERAIGQQLHVYCRAVDRLDAELLKTIWHPDGTVDYGVPELRGAASDVAERIIEIHTRWAYHQHQYANPIIEIDGDHAASECCMMVLLRSLPDAAGRVIDSHYRSRILDRWSCRYGRWGLDHRLLVPDLDWQQDFTEGRTGRRLDNVRDDYVYELLATVGVPDGSEHLTQTSVLNARAMAWEVANASNEGQADT